MHSIENLKNHVIEQTYNKDFISHEWYYEHHLKIVEQLVNELCLIYTSANREIINIMIRMHDYDKICQIGCEDRDSKYYEILKKYGYDNEIINQTLEYINTMEKKNEIDISQAPIEVQIISSADGASHFIGPFMHIHFREYHKRDISTLMESNIKKAIQDRMKKITLPEVKQFTEPRYHLLMEQMGLLPDKFL